MKQQLGKVSITPKGTWNSTTAYECLDTVNFGGSSWLAKRANTAVSPVEGDDWMQLSAKGADAEVTKDSIVEALGYEPEKLDKGWELIDTVTISDDETVSLVLNQEPDGTAYNFKEIWVFLKGKQNVTVMYVFLNNTNFDSIGLLRTSKTDNYWSFFKYAIRGKLIEGGYLAGAGYLGETMSYRDNTPSLAYAGGKSSITSVAIKTNSTTAIASGSIFYIYAIRN